MLYTTISNRSPSEKQVLTKIVHPRFKILHALSLYHRQLFHQQWGSFINFLDNIVDHDPTLADSPFLERLVCPFDGVDAVELCPGYERDTGYRVGMKSLPPGKAGWRLMIVGGTPAAANRSNKDGVTTNIKPAHTTISGLSCSTMAARSWKKASRASWLPSGVAGCCFLYFSRLEISIHESMESATVRQT